MKKREFIILVVLALAALLPVIASAAPVGTGCSMPPRVDRHELVQGDRRSELHGAPLTRHPVRLLESYKRGSNGHKS